MVAEYLIGTIEAWLAVEDTARPASLGPTSRRSGCSLDETWQQSAH